MSTVTSNLSQYVGNNSGNDPYQKDSNGNYLMPMSLSAISMAVVTPKSTTIVNCGTVANAAGNSRLVFPMPATIRNVTSTDRYEIGSETKLFTALALALLMQQNPSVSLSATLPSSFNVPSQCTINGNNTTMDITLRELATHNAGLPDLPDNAKPVFGPANPEGRQNYTMADLENAITCDQMQFRPGNGFVYSDLGFAVLGAFLAMTSGNPYGTLIQNLIAKPLGMSGTNLEVPIIEIPNAPGPLPIYTVDVIPTCGPAMVTLQTGECFFDNDNAFSGAGGLFSTIQDMARFVTAEVTPASNPPTPMQQAIAQTQNLVGLGQPCPPVGQKIGCTPNATGLAWQAVEPAWLTTKAPAPVLWKNGGTNGSVSLTVIEPAWCWGATFLTNASSADAVNLWSTTGFALGAVQQLQPTQSQC